MRVVYLWSQISGYMAACWKALHAVDGIEVQVLAFQPEQGQDIAFKRDLVAGIEVHWLKRGLAATESEVLEKLEAIQPDCLAVGGWFVSAYKKVIQHPAMAGCKKVFIMDNPWLGTWRQYLSILRNRNYLKHFDAYVVTGERSFQYMHRLNGHDRRIYRSSYCVGTESLRPAIKERLKEWPRRFLYVGRYSAEKGIDTLIAAYRAYRGRVEAPWALVCCGAGPLASELKACEGIEDQGFVQPDELTKVFSGCGTFILPSTYDPWPLVIVEAAASGLPLIASNASGSAVELLREAYNGLFVATSSVEELCEAMQAMHATSDAELAGMGRRSQSLAQAYSPELYAMRWSRILHQKS